MNKKITVLICVLIVIIMMFGACAAKKADTATQGPMPDNNAAIVVAKVNGEPIYKDKFNASFVNACEKEGVPEEYLENEAYAGLIQGFKEQILESLIAEQVILATLQEKGYMDLTTEQITQAAQMLQDELDLYAQYAMASITAELEEGYTDEQLKAATEKYQESLIENSGATREEILEIYKEAVAVKAAKEDFLGDIEPTEQEVKAQYDSKVQSDKDAMSEDMSVYEAYESQGIVPYYVPAGIRRVKQILIKLEDDIVSTITELRTSGDDEGADELLEENLAGIKERADEVLTKLQSEQITFDEGIENYNDDTGMEHYTEGYTVMEASTSWLEPFTKGAMALEEIGDITDLIITDYGYHIIEYSSDISEGAIDYESVRQEIYDTVLVSLQDEAWYDLIEEWKQDIQIEYLTENL